MVDLTHVALGVLMPGLRGTTMPDWLARAAGAGLGGVCLFAENTPDVPTARALTDALHAENADLCLTVDEEGGDVTRLQRVHGSSFPGNEALGAVDDLELTREVGAAVGALVAAAGIDLTLAPCVDVASNPRNPVIATRSFGADPDRVSRHAAAFVDGLHAAATGGCAKHFPGHGDTSVDSHLALPHLTHDLGRLATRDVAAFAALVGTVDAMMTGHLVVCELGPAAASVSRWAYQWLRDLGHQGPIMTDALGMRAVSEPDGGQGAGIGNATVRALAAGADMACLDSPHNRDPETTFDECLTAVVAALKSGQLDVDQLTRSAARTRACVRQVRARRAGDARPPRLADLDTLGLAAARRALIVKGPVRLDPSRLVGFVDLRVKLNLASGRIGTVLMDAVDQGLRRAGRPPVQPVELSEVAAAQAAKPGLQLVLQTREPMADPVEAERLAQALALASDAVVLHAGMAQSAPVAARLVCTHGTGRVNGQAAAEALLGQSLAGARDHS